jgi:hypothetical protein
MIESINLGDAQMEQTLNLIAKCEHERDAALARMDFRAYSWFAAKVASLTLRLQTYIV